MEKSIITHLARQEQVDKIYKWNFERGNTKFSKDLELKMLTEEFSEYYAADDIVGKLDAIADLLFVYEGTLFKIENNELDFDKDIERYVVYVGQDLFALLLQDFIKEYGFDVEDMRFVKKVILKTLDIVIEANEQKGKEKTKDGKIKKPEGFIKPEERIYNEVVKVYFEDCLSDEFLTSPTIVDVVEAYRKGFITKTEAVAILYTRYNTESTSEKTNSLYSILDNRGLKGEKLYNELKKVL